MRQSLSLKVENITFGSNVYVTPSRKGVRKYLFNIYTFSDEVIAADAAVWPVTGSLHSDHRGTWEDRMPNSDIRFGPRSPDTMIMVLWLTHQYIGQPQRDNKMPHQLSSLYIPCIYILLAGKKQIIMKIIHWFDHKEDNNI